MIFARTIAGSLLYLESYQENLPVLALTATANQRVEQDIRQQVGMDALLVRGSMRRSNLHLNVVNVSGDKEKLSYLAANLPTWPGSGIIYTGTKRSAEMVTAFLRQQGSRLVLSRGQRR